MDKIRIFLSSAMNKKSWRLEREAIIALFKHSPLSSLCELSYIEGESGQIPKHIYTHMLKDTHLVLVLLADELRPGVEDELKTAIALGKPILAFEKKDAKPNEGLKKFYSSIMNDVTTRDAYSSLDELLSKIQSALVGLLTRALANLMSVGLLVRKQAAHLVETGGTKKDKLSFASFAVSAGQVRLAKGFLEQEYDANGLDGDIQIALAAVSLLLNQPLPEALVLDLKYGKARGEKGNWLLAFHYLFGRQLEEVKAIVASLKPPETAAAVEKMRAYLEALEAFEGNEEEYVELVKEIPGEEIEELEVVEIDGLFPASNLSIFVQGELESVEVELSRSFLEKVHFAHCLTCMPYEDGEPVVIYPAIGTLRFAIDETLYDEYPDIEWCEVNLREPHVSCPGCGAPVESYSDVFGDWEDHAEEEEE